MTIKEYNAALIFPEKIRIHGMYNASWQISTEPFTRKEGDWYSGGFQFKCILNEKTVYIAGQWHCQMKTRLHKKNSMELFLRRNNVEILSISKL